MKIEYKKVSDLLALNNEEALQEFEMVELKGGSGPVTNTGTNCDNAGGHCKHAGDECVGAGLRCKGVGSGCGGTGDHCLVTPVIPPFDPSKDLPKYPPIYNPNN